MNFLDAKIYIYILFCNIFEDIFVQIILKIFVTRLLIVIYNTKN